MTRLTTFDGRLCLNKSPWTLLEDHGLINQLINQTNTPFFGSTD